MKVLGVDEGSFTPWRKGKTLLLGALLHSKSIIEDVLISKIEIDGLDATETLIKMVKGHKGMIDLIMLTSIPYAGFNLMDPTRLYKELKIPVIVVNPEKPNNKAVKMALQRHFHDWKKRFQILKKIGKPSQLKIDSEKTLYFYTVGLSERTAAKKIRESIIVGYRPEPLRVARLLAHGLSIAL